MSTIKNKAQSISPEAAARDINQLVNRADNLYEALAVISHRADQITQTLKRELNDKLNEFTDNSDTIEEIVENKEQIEVSKVYERLPNPALIAMSEFVNDELAYRYKSEEEEQMTEDSE